MEHDDGEPSAARTIVKGAVVSSLAASGSLSRAQKVQKLIADINGALEIPTGAPNFDDRVGSTQEFVLSNSLLNVAAGPKTKTLTIVGDGGTTTSREVTSAPSLVRSYCATTAFGGALGGIRGTSAVWA